MSSGNTFQFTPPQQPLPDHLSVSHCSIAQGSYSGMQNSQQIQYCFGGTTNAGKQIAEISRNPMQLKFTICPLEEQEAEKSDSGSSYSSMEVLNVSSSSLVSDICLNHSLECKGDAVMFSFESVKDEALMAVSTGDMPVLVVGESGRSKLLDVSPEHLGQGHRRTSLPTEVPKKSFSFLRNRLSASARNLFFRRGSSIMSSSSSNDSVGDNRSGNSLEDINKLSVGPRSHKSGSLDCQLLALSADHLRRAKSEHFEKKKSPRRDKLKLRNSRRSPLEIIKSSLHLDRSPARRRSPSGSSPLEERKKVEERIMKGDEFEVRSLMDVKVGGGSKSILSLPEQAMAGGIPMVVVHSPQTVSSLSCEHLPSVGSWNDQNIDDRTSPAPLMDLFQNTTMERHQSKTKPSIQRVASVDSAKTVVHGSRGAIETTTTTSELDIKTSDSNDKIGSYPLSLPLSSTSMTSPKKVMSGKSSSSGDASIKVGKSSSSSSESKKKKTSSWYNVLSPSYKSRSEDFKRIFKALPSSERLIVEYSCALQKDILIQGRMYVSQSWICFYANIFRWETILMIRCKDIVKLTKEKTARVIPNAIQICTRDDRYFFASFGARDKVFIQLDLVRKNATNEMRMNRSEFWSWVHLYYGDDLGLTSDDDDYMPVTPEDKSKFQAYLQNELGQAQEGIEIAKDALEDLTLSHPSITSSATPTAGVSKRGTYVPTEIESRKVRREGSPVSIGYSENGHRGFETLPTESASSEDDEDEEIVDYCAGHSHFSIDVLDEAFNMSVDDVFHHCFSDSQIYREFVKAKKTFDVKLNPWTIECDADGKEQKTRNISYTLTLDFSIGPKHSPSSEKQIMHKESESSRFYLIDTECFNEGIPYGENFFITNRYCISRLSSKRSRLKITSQINYRKNVWGFIKNFLEKNVTAGIVTSFNVLADILRLESDRQLIPMTTASSQLQHSLSRNKFLRRRRAGGICEGTMPTEAGFIGQSQTSTPVKQGSVAHSRTSSVSRFKFSEVNQQPTVDSLVWFVCTVLVILMLFNGMLFCKLWSLESTATNLLKSKFHDQQYSLFNPQINSELLLDKKMEGKSLQKPKQHDLHRGGAKRSRRRRVKHDQDIDQWKSILVTSIRLMDQMKASLIELRNNIVDLERDELNSKTEANEGGDGGGGARNRV